MIKILFVILPLPTSLRSHNNSTHKKHRNSWALESGIYGQTRVGECGTLWLITGFLLQSRSVENMLGKNLYRRLFDLSRITRLKFDLPLPNKFLVSSCLIFL